MSGARGETRTLKLYPLKIAAMPIRLPEHMKKNGGLYRGPGVWFSQKVVRPICFPARESNPDLRLSDAANTGAAHVRCSNAHADRESGWISRIRTGNLEFRKLLRCPVAP